MNRILKEALIAMASTVLIFAGLFAWAVIKEQTFGQRAAKKYLWGTSAWEAEVQRLRNEQLE